MSTAMPRLILASTSNYRRELLERLRLPFTTASPKVDELPRPGESPKALATRLATAKAEAVAKLHPDAWVIGADQVADCDDEILGKPGTAERARAQLAICNGRVVSFHTAARLVGPADGQSELHVDLTRVKFRLLEAAEIERYVELDQPLDCAGSFRSEGLGITLFDRLECDDPTALVGLPLIWLAGALRRAGFDSLALGACL
jgi:septum formation protein